MYKIVLLKSPGNLNVGNEFINVGAEYLVRKCLEQAKIKDYELFISEFWETGNLHHKTGSSWNTKEMKAFVNQCDLVIVSAGSVNMFMQEFLHDVSQFVPPTIILGAGFYRYTQQEKELAKQAFSRARLILCRDYVVYDAFKNDMPAVNGLDMAFFVNDAYAPPFAKGNYAVLNIDIDFKRMFSRMQKYRELKKKFERVYLTEHNSVLYAKKNFVFLSRWTEFCNLYANAAFVSTGRIHAAVICTIFHTPFEYFGKDCEPNAKRSALFRQIGMPLERGKRYTVEELKEKKALIQQKKQEVIDALALALRQCLSSPTVRR